MRLIRRSGFTLIEIMIVVTIIALLLAIAIPNFMRAREISRARTCQTNLRQLMTAKEQWAMNMCQPSDSTPTPESLVTEYIKNCYEDVLPQCPTGGTYTIGDLSTRPVCSVGTNINSADWDDHFLNQ